MGYSSHGNLYYGIKVNHQEAKRIEDLFVSLAPLDEDDDEEFALSNGLMSANLESFNLAGENADGRIQSVEGYIDNYQSDIPYYAFGVWIAERKTKLSEQELNKKGKNIHEQWQKVIPFLEQLGLKNNPEYLIINQTM